MCSQVLFNMIRWVSHPSSQLLHRPRRGNWRSFMARLYGIHLRSLSLPFLYQIWHGETGPMLPRNYHVQRQVVTSALMPASAELYLPGSLDDPELRQIICLWPWQSSDYLILRCQGYRNVQDVQLGRRPPHWRLADYILDRWPSEPFIVSNEARLTDLSGCFDYVVLEPRTHLISRWGGKLYICQRYDRGSHNALA